MPHSLPTPSDTPEEAPEERRSRWLLLFLLLPILIAPGIVAFTAQVIGLETFPWPLVGAMFQAAGLAACFGGLLVLMVPKLSAFFGTPTFSRPGDERETLIFHRSLLVSYMLTAAALLIANFTVTLVDSLRPGAPVVTVLMIVQGVSLWTTMIFYSRRI
jgi:hypothetical protein